MLKKRLGKRRHVREVSSGQSESYHKFTENTETTVGSLQKRVRIGGQVDLDFPASLGKVVCNSLQEATLDLHIICVHCIQ